MIQTVPPEPVKPVKTITITLSEHEALAMRAYIGKLSTSLSQTSNYSTRSFNPRFFALSDADRIKAINGIQNIFSALNEISGAR